MQNEIIYHKQCEEHIFTEACQKVHLTEGFALSQVKGHY